jgi:hypothetical protein
MASSVGGNPDNRALSASSGKHPSEKEEVPISRVLQNAPRSRVFPGQGTALARGLEVCANFLAPFTIQFAFNDGGLAYHRAITADGRAKECAEQCHRCVSWANQKGQGIAP